MNISSKEIVGSKLSFMQAWTLLKNLSHRDISSSHPSGRAYLVERQLWATAKTTPYSVVRPVLKDQKPFLPLR